MKINSFKTIFLITVSQLLLSNFTPSFAQDKQKDSNEVETLFGDNISNGGYGALMLGYTQIADRNTMTAGIKGAWIINHSIGIGIAGNGFFSKIHQGIIPDEEWSAITGGYGGLLLEPIFFGKKPVHVSIPLIIGGGAIFYGNSLDYNNGYYPDYSYNYSNFFDYYFIFEPGIELEFNLTKFFRLATGVSYRFTSDIDITRTVDDVEYQVIKPGDLRNFNVNLVFKFGKF